MQLIVAILCIFKVAIQQVRHLGRGKEWIKKETINEKERRACNQKSDFPHMNSPMKFLS